MPGEEEARLGLSSAQLATTVLTPTTTTTLSSGGSGTASSIQSSSTGVSSSSSSLAATGGASSSSSALPKVSLPALALSSGNRGTSGLYSGASSGFEGGNIITPLTTAGTTTPLTPILIASCPPSNNIGTTLNNNFASAGAATTTTITTNNRTGPGIISNLNSTGLGTLDGGLLNSNNLKQQPFQSNPLPGGASNRGPAPTSLLANLNNSSSLLSSSSSGSASAGLLGSYSNKHPFHVQYQQQQPQLSLKPIIATPNGNPPSASVAESIKRDTGTCNGHGHHHPYGGGGRALVDDDEIDEAGDSSKLELQHQFAGIDNETAVDVDVDEEENNFEGIESGPMCTVVPSSKRNGNGGGGGGGGGSGSNGGGEKSGGGHPSSSFPGGDVPSGGSGTMVVASSAAAAGSVAPATSTTSSTLGGAVGAATGPTNSLAAPGTTTSGVGGGGGTLGEEEEEDEEEDVEGGKTVECTEVVVPVQTFAEKCLFYTTAFFILLAVFSLFAFLFLVPFVIDPAFTTIFMEFDPEPALCQTVSFEQKEGLSNCSWTSCREGCTREVFQCKQIRVNYRSARKSHSDKQNNADFQQQQLQQLRRPNTLTKNMNINNVNKNFINNNYHGGSSSYQLASSDLRRSSEHSGSSFNIPFNTLITTNNLNIYNNLVNNGFGGGGGGDGVGGGTGGGIINTYHSASSTGGGIGSFRDASSSKLSKAPSHYKSLMNALHHSSKYAVYSGSGAVAGRDLSTASLLSHVSSASDVRPSGGVGGAGAEVMFLRSSKHSQQLKSASVQPLQKLGRNGEEPFWDYTGAHLFPNVKGCGYPPVVVCSDFVDKYGKEGTNFSCYYSKVDRALVVTKYDMSRVIMDLIYSMAIPIPSFIISVVYLIFAYFRIYNTEASSSTHETGGGGRAERLNSSSTTTNLQNPGSANRGGGGSSADDPDGETSLSIDDKTCIIQRSTSRGLNALSDKLPNSGKGLHAQVIEMNDLNPQLRHPVDGDVFLPQKRNNNCSNNPANPERNGPTNPAAKNKGEETTATTADPAVEVEAS